MNYQKAVRSLYALAPRGVVLGLDRVERALEQRGHPERAIPSILVAGTNGKGSVSAMLASVLRASGRKVGLYTSPHLHRLVERFQVNGRAISERELVRRVSELMPFLASEGAPELTFFEACTLLAFEIFRDARCDVAVLEVGLGGRLDATNVVTPLVSVITRIALDHADRLGPTLAHIAREKAGIVKRGVPLVLGAREPEVLAVVRDRARRVGAPRLEIDRDFVATREGEAYRVRVRAETLERLSVPLAGDYQADNLACAVATLVALRERGLCVDAAKIRRGLSRVRWPGRLELVAGAPSVLLDAAHNPDACAALGRELARLSGRFRKRVLVFGVLADKDPEAMLGALSPQVHAIVFTTPHTPRAVPAGELCKKFGGMAVPDPLKAYARAKRLAGKRGLVVVAGSIFAMASVRAHLLGEPSDPPIAM